MPAILGPFRLPKARDLPIDCAAALRVPNFIGSASTQPCGRKIGLIGPNSSRRNAAPARRTIAQYIEVHILNKWLRFAHGLARGVRHQSAPPTAREGAVAG